MTKLKIGAAALNQTPLDWEGNLRNIKTAIEQARAQGVDILCLPEMCVTGYGCEDLFLSEWLPTKALQLLGEIKEWCSDISVAVGVPFRCKGDLYNTACLIHNTKIVGITAKQWLANDGVHYEPRWFNSWPAGKVEEASLHGDTFPLGDVLYKVHGINMAFEICEDAWRSTSRPAIRHHEKNVDLILNPSASHFSMGKSKLREELVCTSSTLYECTYVYANMLGNEAGRMIYDGELLITHHGKMVQRNRRLSFKDVNLITAEIDFANRTFEPQEVNQDPQDKETEFVQATSLALFDYMRKSHSNGFVLSLSGGADSSACAVLVAELIRRGCKELGVKAFLEKAGYTQLYQELKAFENAESRVYKKIASHLLVCAYQGTKNSSEATFNSARQLAEDVGAVFYHWLIDEEVESYTNKIEKAIGQELSWETDDITLQNIQARARSPIIWMLANKRNGLLLTTSNRSEGDVGYATMDGDTSGGLAPIAGIDKHFLLKWLRWAEAELGYSGLQYVNRLKPSAELRPGEEGQTDEDDLMPYSVIVAIERLAIRERFSPVQVFYILRKEEVAPAAHLKQYLLKFYRLWSRNQWKRERLAPGFHLDDFNIDPRSWFRFPILSGGFAQELEELRKIEV
ncbi:NAD(+) synthase [Nafulsella turpanensis]|uniref:NAD(+) synthase n=1 Tax=Nafulsella turpanensis TaxID=1265690 RepID=UPI00034B664E|nr:NAD(+) synthase [Nafulsella turpanensis]